MKPNFRDYNPPTTLQPSLAPEKKLWRKGYKRVAGLDEAGRGPLAGPVVAAAVILNSKLKTQKSKLQLKTKNLLKEVKDSKKLMPKKREALYKFLIKDLNIEWGIGRVSEKVIDKINILEATKLAMVRAVKNLEKKYSQADFLILDGNFTLPAEALAKAGIDKSISQKSIIKGDNKVFSVAAASILAKVYRDKIMERYDRKFPKYEFKKHKGYGTKFHFKMLKKYGPCKIHRKTFGPVKNLKLLK